MREGFVAGCRHCGAPHSLHLFDVSAPCGYCRAPDPLTEESRARLAAAAKRVSSLAAREQRLQQLRSDAGFDTALTIGLFSGTSWLLFGGIALSIAFSEKPEGVSVLQLLGSDYVAEGNGPETAAVLAWWLFFLLFVGVLATALTGVLLTYWQRRPVKPERALPPLEQGSPPRCHLCGAGLAGGAGTLRCGSCGASNLVDGAAFSAQLTQLDEQLRWIDAALGERGARVGRSVDALVKFTAFFPIVLLLALPLGLLLVPRTAPELLPALWVLVGLLVAAALALVLQRGVAAPAVHSTGVGGGVRVRGELHRVVGVLRATASDYVGARELRVLAPAHGGAPSLLLCATVGAARTEVVAYALREGGEPYAPGIALVPYALEAPQGGGPVALSSEASPRCFDANTASGAPPRWTLTKLALEGDDVVAV